MITIKFESVKDQVKVTVEAEGCNHELANEIGTMIVERNNIVMKLIAERPWLAPILSKFLERNSYYEQND